MSSLAIDDLSLSPFKNFAIFFSNHSFNLIVGTSGSGKTRLLKALAGLLKTQEKVRYNRTYIEKISFSKLQGKIGLVFPELLSSLSSFTVEDSLKNSLEPFSYEKKEQEEKIKNMLSFINITGKRKKYIKDLSAFEQLKILFAVELIKEPEVLLLDEPLKKIVSKEEKKSFLKLLEHCYQKGLSIIMTSSSLEDTMLSSFTQLYILDHGNLILKGEPLEVLKKDSILNKLGLKIPFMVDLCVKLEYYKMVDEIILEEEKLIDKIWN